MNQVIFNGNGYDAANQKALTEAGLWRIDSGVDAIRRFTEPKNVALFQNLKILTPEECQARENVMLAQYVGTVEIEANCLVDMFNQHIIPAVKTAGVGPLEQLLKSVFAVQDALLDIHHTASLVEKVGFESRVPFCRNCSTRLFYSRCRRTNLACSVSRL